MTRTNTKLYWVWFCVISWVFDVCLRQRPRWAEPNWSRENHFLAKPTLRDISASLM